MDNINAHIADLILLQLNPVDSSLIAENFGSKVIEKRIP